MRTVPIEWVDPRLLVCVRCGRPSVRAFQAWQQHYTLGLFAGRVDHAPWFGYCEIHSAPRYRLSYPAAIALAELEGLR